MKREIRLLWEWATEARDGRGAATRRPGVAPALGIRQSVSKPGACAHAASANLHIAVRHRTELLEFPALDVSAPLCNKTRLVVVQACLKIFVVYTISAPPTACGLRI